MPKPKYYKTVQYHDKLEAVIIFIKAHGLKYLTDIDEYEECKAAVEWMIESKRGPGFTLTASYFASSVKKYRSDCVKALQNSDLESKEYRDKFAATFMQIIDNLTFIPSNRKEQIRKVIKGEKSVVDEKKCIVLLQDLLYAILPKFYKDLSSDDIKAMVAAASNLESPSEECDDSE